MSDGPPLEREIPPDIQAHDVLGQIWIERRDLLLDELIEGLNASKEQSTQFLNTRRS